MTNAYGLNTKFNICKRYRTMCTSFWRMILKAFRDIVCINTAHIFINHNNYVNYLSSVLCFAAGLNYLYSSPYNSTR